MITQFRVTGGLAAILLAAALVHPAAAQTRIGYGVNGNNILFRFDLDNPNAAVTNIGNVGFGPEGIDFRPTTTQGDTARTLYGIDIGPNTTQLYTISTVNGAATPVGAGFPSTGVDYNLLGNQTFGFDVNPTTLQGDGSIRIRLVGSSGVNLRLNSDTGLIAAVDGMEMYAGGADPNGTGAGFVDGVAYINSDQATMGGTTVLFAMDTRTDDLSIQNPPNAGTLNTVGPFGVSIDALAPVHFDILTARFNTDTSIVGDTGYAVYRRPNIEPPGPGNYLLYDVNLATGETTSGALVGIAGGNPAADFTGGLAVIAVPEPAAAALAVLAGLTGCGWTRRRRSAR